MLFSKLNILNSSQGPPLSLSSPQREAGSGVQELRALQSRTEPSRLGAEASCTSTPCKVHSHSFTTPSRFVLSGFWYSLYLRLFFRCSLFSASLAGEEGCAGSRKQLLANQSGSFLLFRLWKDAQEQVFSNSSLLMVMVCNTKVTARLWPPP